MHAQSDLGMSGKGKRSLLHTIHAYLNCRVDCIVLLTE